MFRWPLWGGAHVCLPGGCGAGESVGRGFGREAIPRDAVPGLLSFRQLSVGPLSCLLRYIGAVFGAAGIPRGYDLELIELLPSRINYFGWVRLW